LDDLHVASAEALGLAGALFSADTEVLQGKELRGDFYMYWYRSIYQPASPSPHPNAC
jgi:hypothetical protein